MSVNADTPWFEIDKEKILTNAKLECPRCGNDIWTNLRIGDRKIVNCPCGISWRFKLMVQEAI